MMKNDYKLYGIHISYFVGKVRAYLNYKNLDYVEKSPTTFDFSRFGKKLNAAVMPVVETRSGELIDATTEIIEKLEKRHPEPSITPPSAIQNISSMLFETWMDEVGHLIAIRTRWCHEENYPLFRDTFGKSLFPWLPKFIRTWLLERTAIPYLRKHQAKLGVVPENAELLDRWITYILDTLENHFSQYDYLFGGRPCIADYALIGVCYGHLYTDPWPRRELIDPRPNLKAYIERTHRGDAASGDWIPNDEVPSTLQPIFQMIADEFYPLITETVSTVNNYIKTKDKKSGDVLTRFPGSITFPMMGEKYSKVTFSYTLWMLQRVRNTYRLLNDEQQIAVDSWFASQGVEDFRTLNCGPDVHRHGLQVRLV